MRSRGTLCYRLSLTTGTRPGKATFTTVLSICESLVYARILHSCSINAGLEADTHVGTALVTAYSKSGSIKDASTVFRSIQIKNTVSYNAMIVAYTQENEFKQAMQTFRQMQLEGIDANSVTLRAVLEACSTVAGLAEGRKIHARINLLGKNTSSLRNALLLMYGKCGRVGDAWDVFEEIAQPDVLAWTVMAETYASNGLGSKAVSLFWKMQQEGNKPNDASVTMALSACSHAGLVGQGKQLFVSVLAGEFPGLPVSASHFGCIVDLLGRAGQLQLAEELLLRLPAEVGPPVMWTTLLGACKSHGDVERGKRVAKRLTELDSGDESGSYLLLSNMLTGSN